MFLQNIYPNFESKSSSIKIIKTNKKTFWGRKHELSNPNLRKSVGKLHGYWIAHTNINPEKQLPPKSARQKSPQNHRKSTDKNLGGSVARQRSKARVIYFALSKNT